MRRPVWFRALVALWGIWFSTVLVEPAGVLACQMHSGAAGANASHSAGHAPETAHGGHGADAVHQHAMGADASAPQHAPSEHQNCTCLGQCCTMALDLSVDAADELLQPIVSLAASVSRPLLVERLVTPVEHARPFANGPPMTMA